MKSERERIIEKLSDIQDEIMRIGWDNIIKLYHPDMNTEDPEAVNVFKLYKHVYENMKKRLMLQP